MSTSAIGFIGAGRSGTALATALARASYPVTFIASRTFDHAQALAKGLRGAVAYPNLQQVADRCDIVFLTVPDDTIASVCRSIEWRPETQVIHCSGAHSLEPLEHARESGAAIGAFHPLQSLPAGGYTPDVFRDVSFAIEASTDALKENLSQMAHDLGGRCIEVKGADKPLYHASAAMASNYLVALLGDAAKLWESFGLSRETGLNSLLPLVKGTMDNLQGIGFPDALTGPIARGDVDTIRIHLQALKASQPDIIASYAAMGRRTVALGLEKGTLSNDAAQAIRKLLDEAGNLEDKA